MNRKPCMLMILDGWGINPEENGNAVAQAGTPYLDQLRQTYPNSELVCSGEAVGLPAGIMGNSEVGHLNIGAGRIVYQDLMRIDKAIEDRTFFENQALLSVAQKVKANNSALHLMGLVSDGGVHSQLTHLFALLQMAKENGLERVYVHAILDGRDTAPDSGVVFIQQLQDYIDANQVGAIATICGRYYAMDRDTRWDRTAKAYDLYTQGFGIREVDPVVAVQNAYGRGETDEFVVPVKLTTAEDTPIAGIADDDGLVFFNFRADRARQITRAFTESSFAEFERVKRPAFCEYVSMTLYDEHFSLPMAFPPVHLEGILGEVVSQAGKSQLRIAETEKYAHVTYFFNGGEEAPFPNEARCLIPSPREIATYDQKPEMSAREVTKEVLARIDSDKYDLIVLNFANMDMVGHTGIIEAAIQAVRTVDDCVRQIVTAVLGRNGSAMITADHGNAEKMRNENGGAHTAHTLNPVPFILADDERKGRVLKKGKLGDIAPTILEIMGIEKPETMTGISLLGE